ncbi:hypothetical protein ONR57_20230 [Hoyosella sp. YIM 151337]|uniref:hypothetical protein n=1 Tax=Hoyosella sp. YIM 151337 TaxID=2992742 RepID=UPI002235DC62|nr:hypothetical protein [Hoyosella sp. YIM 151337]MCW4355637.1 hypothetical protein [Hoyosella sp. YIM 151337]
MATDSGADFGALLARLGELSDHDLSELVAEVTVHRSHLRALHQVAQLSAIAGPAPVEGTDDASISVAGGVVAPRDVSEGPVGEVPPLEDPGTTGDAALEPGWTKDGIPTFSRVRDKIAARFAVAIGAPDAAIQEAEDRSLEQQWEARARAARERLNQIRGLMQK